MTVKNGQPICVLGCIDTPTGHAIADELLGWLKWYYTVFEVWHDGTQYEYPALHTAQAIAKATGLPVLYLHTKGACNHGERSRLIRKMWRKEFVLRKDYYLDLVRNELPVVATQFTGADRFTRYNGFIANAAAWSAIPEIQPNADRSVYEVLWRDEPHTAIVGTIFNDITSQTLRKAHNYLLLNF